VATYEVKFATSTAKGFRSLSTELKYRIGAAIDGLSPIHARRGSASWWGTNTCVESV